jgi:hypothetical protein
MTRTSTATGELARSTTFAIRLRGVVRRAVQRRQVWLSAGVLFTGLTEAVAVASGAPFPTVLPLASLLPAGGGDGSAGFVLTGIDVRDRSGDSVSAAGDVSDGIDDLIVGGDLADPGGRSHAGESYVVFGRSAGP